MKTENRTHGRLTSAGFALLLMFFCRHAHTGPGGWDQTYTPTLVGGAVNALALQPDGKLLIGGAFTSVNGSGSRARLARLLADGSLDPTFFNSGSGVANAVWCLAVQKDDRIVIGGDFLFVNGTARTRVARLNTNGILEATFIPTNVINGSVLALAVQSDNKVVIGGVFTGGSFPSWNARLNADGTTDTNFNSLPNGAVNAIAIQPDGKIIIGGTFTTVSSIPRSRIARLNPNGSVDTNFLSNLVGANNQVRCLHVQADGKILVGGDFTAFNATARGYVARLNTNGTLDTGFVSTPGADRPVYAIALQPDNRVLIAGDFTTYATLDLSRVARLNVDGKGDTNFSTFGINNRVQSLAVQNDGSVLVGGTFTTVNNANRASLAQLYGDLYPPEFATQPVSRATNVGATVIFSAAINNPTPSSFQWRKNGTNLAGATLRSYTLNNVQLADAGNYSAFVSNAAGGTTSSNAVLQVGIAPAITGQPVSLIVTQGQSATFSVTTTGTPLHYFWKKDGVFIPGATNSAYTIAAVSAGNVTTYTCQVSNFLGSVTSVAAPLTVYSPLAITVQPVSQTVAIGSAFTVSVTATGNPAPAYQWRKDGTEIPGATAASYSMTGAQTNDSGGYSVGLINILGMVTSVVAQVRVGDVPLITQQPQRQIATQGDAVAFNVSVAAQTPLAYEWRKDGVPIAAATNSTLLLPDVQPTQAGLYSVAISNGFTHVVSASAALAVISASGPGAPGFTGDKFGFGLSGPAGNSFIVESSANLTGWQAIATDFFGPGMFLFLDPASSTKPIMFYRVFLP